jgi:hypothetical protein
MEMVQIWEGSFALLRMTGFSSGTNPLIIGEPAIVPENDLLSQTRRLLGGAVSLLASGKPTVRIFDTTCTSEGQ